MALVSGWPDGDDAAQLGLDLVAAREHVLGVGLRVVRQLRPRACACWWARCRAMKCSACSLVSRSDSSIRTISSVCMGLSPSAKRSGADRCWRVPKSIERRAVKAAQHPGTGLGLDSPSTVLTSSDNSEQLKRKFERARFCCCSACFPDSRLLFRRAAELLPKPRRIPRATPPTRRSRRATDGELKNRMDASSPCASSGGRRRAGARAQARCDVRATQAMDGAQTSAASAGAEALCRRSGTQKKYRDVLAAVDIARVGRARRCERGMDAARRARQAGGLRPTTRYV